MPYFELRISTLLETEFSLLIQVCFINFFAKIAKIEIDHSQYFCRLFVSINTGECKNNKTISRQTMIVISKIFELQILVIEVAVQVNVLKADNEKFEAHFQNWPIRLE